MEKNVFTEIRVKYNTLSKNQKTVANYILKNSKKCVRMTLSELGRECNLSETTIIRFINKLDYTSYQAFRLDMAQDIIKDGGTMEEEDYDIKPGDSISEVKRKVIRNAASAINDISKLVDNRKLTSVIELIENAERVMFFGAGGSGVIAMDVYHKFLKCGKNVIHESNTHLALIHAAHLTNKDVLVLISHEGESKEVLECARIAQSSGAKVIGLTSYMNSDLAKMADLCIFSSTNDAAYYTEAMVSRLVQLVIMDILVVAYSTRLGDTDASRNIVKAIEASDKALEEMKKKTEEKDKI